MLNFVNHAAIFALLLTPLSLAAQQVLPPSAADPAMTAPPPPPPPPPPPAPMQMPPSVATECFTDGVNCMTGRRYVWVIGATGHTVTVPPGFVTDFASIPASARVLFERQGRYSRAAVIHDMLYWSQACTRAQADNLFYIAMKESDVPWASRTAIHSAVRAGGQSAWKQNEADRKRGLGRVVPEDHVDLANRFSWAEARIELLKFGIGDPPLPVDPAVCALGDALIVP